LNILFRFWSQSLIFTVLITIVDIHGSGHDRWYSRFWSRSLIFRFWSRSFWYYLIHGISHNIGSENHQRGMTGEMSKYVPFLHSESSHLLPTQPTDTILALNESWYCKLHEDVLIYPCKSQCAQLDGGQSPPWLPKP
jgi:hypothetical protein